MSDKKGFTMIEIIVVSLLIAGSLTTSLYIFSSTKGVNQNESVEQRFYELRSKLLTHLQKDIRSSLTITEENIKGWRLEVVTWNSKEISKTQFVKYWINDKNTKVYRECGGKKSEYNFTDILEGKKLVFSIKP